MSSDQPQPADSLPDLSIDGKEPRESPRAQTTAKDLKQIGPYKILQKIAEGGMGAVYMAEQSQPIKRRVALKLIKAGRDTEQIIARFDAERQALAMMDHANIARIFDAGATDDGSPYFVMELINGVPLTEYCDRNKLSIRERLELFVPVCKAVQHAHTKGVIHRDLKPSNVLVAFYDGVPVPKVIDFGLAKATEHQMSLTDKTMFTEFGQVVGTLQYMSPEQAEMNQLDIDTRTDVYSLGVMLYELLTGSTPLDDSTMKEQALLKVLELIREKEPPRPSTRLSDSGEAISGVSEQRRIDPSRLQKILRGELDWIIMKSLEKDRTRRYETPNDFAQDISRFLNDEAVSARPPSTSYRLQKFVTKNKGLAASVVTIFSLLVLGLGGISWFAIQSSSEAKRANREAKRAEEALKIFTDSFRSVDPANGANSETLAKDVLFKAQQGLENSELDEAGKAQLLNSLTLSFLGVGEFGNAVATAKSEVAIQERRLGPDHPETLTAIKNLGSSYNNNGEFSEAIKILENAVDTSKAKLGAGHKLTLELMTELATGLHFSSEKTKANNLLESVLDMQIQNLGVENPDTLTTKNNLAFSYVMTDGDGDGEKVGLALKMLEEVLEVRKQTLESDHPSTLTTMNDLAVGYAKTGRTDEAVSVLEELLALQTKKLGLEHPNTLYGMSTLAGAYSDTGQVLKAVDLEEKVLGLRRETLGSDHPHTLETADKLAVAFQKTGQFDKAMQLCQQELEIRQEKLGPKHPKTLTIMTVLALANHKTGQFEEALNLGQQVFEMRQESLGPDHPNTIDSMELLAVIWQKMKKFDEALKLARQVLDLRQEKFGPENAKTQGSRMFLSVLHYKLGQLEEALSHGQQVLKVRRENLGSNHDDTASSMEFVAQIYKKSKQFGKAMSLCEQLVEIREEKLGPEHPKTLASKKLLAQVLSQLEKVDKP